MSSTLYIRNLNEKIKIPQLKETLREMFVQYGPVLDVVAHKNIRMRGQAFVVFDSSEAAGNAKSHLKDKELYNKPMVIEFSRKKSDATVKKDGLEQFLEHKQVRLAEKEDRQAKQQVKNPKKRKSDRTATIPNAPRKKKQDTGRPSADEPPPNKILFLESVSDEVSKEWLESVFSQYPGFVEVRLFAIRHVGFVEYEEEDQAVKARSESEVQLVEKGVKISYAKK